MKRGIAFVLVIVMTVGALGPSIGLDDQIGSKEINAGRTIDDMDHSAIIPPPEGSTDPIADYLLGLDPSGPRPFKDIEPGPILHDGESRFPLYFGSDAIFFYEDSSTDEWLPVPTREDIWDGTLAPVGFENNTDIEIHGKLFEHSIGENTTYFDDIGIPDVPFEIKFDGDPLSTLSDKTGNNTTVTDPFIDTGNGTFKFIVEVNKPAGEYELDLIFEGWPENDPSYMPLNYTAVVFVNHPTIIDMELSAESVTVGEPLTISGSVSDDTGIPVSSVPIQIRIDNVLIGPSSDGMYIDDVTVQGAGFFDDFEDDGATAWNSYAVPGRGVDDQWERGDPIGSVGPIVSHSGSNVYGTRLDGNYDRGAWS